MASASDGGAATAVAAAASSSAAPGPAPIRRKPSLSLRDTRIAGLYDLEHTIGQGHFAVVKLARHVFTGEKVAVKVIDKTKLDPVSTTHIMQEVRCMKLVQHANVVRLYEVIDTPTRLFLVLELGDYDMYDFIAKHEKGCAEPTAQQYFSQIIKAIDYCHQLHVVHRDLKNVVFFEKLGMVKLTDFGFSNLFTPGQQLETSCGSMAYSAPEILLGDAYDAPAVDIWSLGVILYMLVCGRLPFQETNDSETLTKILDCSFSFPDHLSNACKNLISRMLVRDPSKRATLAEIAANTWVVAGDRGHAEALPLIVRHHLPDAAHDTIVEQMVAGGIGTEETVLRALENDEYNYITATYYLLAERVLASYREEQAKALLERGPPEVPEEEPLEMAAEGASRPSSTGGGSKCRSRSNSWRRPCAILKEESEEELSTYLRSSSRQSSRFFHQDSSTSSRSGSSRGRLRTQTEEKTTDESGDESSQASGIHLTPSHRTTSSHHDDLSPIAEGLCEERNSPLRNLPSAPAPLRTASEPHDDHLIHKREPWPRSGTLQRRNSSPSVSMFGVGSASRDRISPQAIQELLELSRIGGAGRQRAASPDSRRSSPSPPPSSGRASPAVSLSLVSRLKAGVVGTSASSVSVGGGMRKLSSSPHLLGICEETEEDGNGSPSSTSAAFSLLAPLRPESAGVARTNRSASTGLVMTGRHGAHSTTPAAPTTYSAVRMIRPRQAVVSPDVCRRYEQHQRFVARSRRSTSCSSSEASDDDTNERRLSMIGSKHCGRKDSDGKGDDDEPPKGGTAGGGTRLGGCASSALSNGGAVHGSAETSNSTAAAGGARQCGAPTQTAWDAGSVMPSSSLQPIFEMPHLGCEGRRQKGSLPFLHRSEAAEGVRRLMRRQLEGSWMDLRRTRSMEELNRTRKNDFEEEFSESSDELRVSLLEEEEEEDELDVFSSSEGEAEEEEVEQSTDSGCSSEERSTEELLPVCLSSVDLRKEQRRRQRIDNWLRDGLSFLGQV